MLSQEEHPASAMPRRTAALNLVSAMSFTCLLRYEK
jgi:hypothetical protein